MAVFDVVIIGGGNLGLWTVYHLAQRSVRRIAVCDGGWFGHGATTRSAGVVRQQGGAETAIKLGMWSRELYLRLGRELGLDSGFVETGYYVLAETEEERKAYQELVGLRRACGLENEWIDAAEGRLRCPTINWSGVAGATFTADDGYVNPAIAARNITIAAARNDAISLFERRPVNGIERRGNVFFVSTPGGVWEAERVVDAAGPRGSRRIGSMLGVTVPVGAVRHHIITVASLRRGTAPGFPMFAALGKGYYVRPEEQGALIGLTNADERADSSDLYQMDFDWTYVDAMRPVWEERFPAVKGVPVARAWTGAVDFTPDHLPIIDEPSPGCFVLAAGGHGMMLGPAMGQKMAELMTEGTIGDLPADEVRLSRFDRPRAALDPIAMPFPAGLD